MAKSNPQKCVLSCKWHQTLTSYLTIQPLRAITRSLEALSDARRGGACGQKSKRFASILRTIS